MKISSFEKYQTYIGLSKEQVDIFSAINVLERVLDKSFSEDDWNFYERGLKKGVKRADKAVRDTVHEPSQNRLITALLLSNLDIKEMLKASAEEELEREQKKEPKKKLLTTINSINSINQLDTIDTPPRSKTLEEKTEMFVVEVKEVSKDFPDLPESVFEQFCSYWTEPSKSKRKLRWEMQPTWDTKRRLNNWANRSSSFASSTGGKGILR